METEIVKQIINLLLDRPEKAEKVFLWTLQTLMTLWGFSLIGFDIVSTLKNGTSSLLDITTSIILFTIVWVVAWGFLIDLLVAILFYFLNPMIRFIRKSSIYIIRLIFFKLKWAQKPRFVWRQQTNHSPVNYTELSDILSFSKCLDRLTNSSAGSENVLKILSYNKKEFMKSRINRYYNIVLIISLANIFLDKDIHLNFWTIIGLGLLYIVGNIISEMIDFYDTIASKYTYYLQPMLEFNIYENFVYHTLLKTPLLFDNYSIKREKKVVILTFKDEEAIYKNLYHEIHFIPTNISHYSQKLTKMKESQSNILVVFLSRERFPLYDLNKITESGYFFIQTTDEAQLVEAVQVLRPIFLGN